MQHMDHRFMDACCLRFPAGADGGILFDESTCERKGNSEGSCGNVCECDSGFGTISGHFWFDDGEVAQIFPGSFMEFTDLSARH